MTPSTTHVPQELLGYRLEARIGAGAFGEVWRAQAPGGVPKAVKLVFGYFDDTRAQRELRALHTVRHLRHPFLLSLERFEVVEGQLVVITELADESLKDCFVKCCHRGLPGIPRDELLGFLADAADGLDYLAEKHLLQHLDIKPENLLLVGSHVKVGDYGLIKDIRQSSQSLMGGMTPAYAAPELFDGRASQMSDQYSLAIVYQEMLTGVRPFSGSTAAQLANQHLTAPPQLEALPRGDQPVIARALSKDPGHRYRTCTEFIQELQRRRKSAPARRTSSAGSQPPGGGDEYASTSPLPVSTVIHRRRLQPSQVQPPLACDGTQASFHPTLLVGIGSTGMAMAGRVRERLWQRLGRTDAAPAVQALCLDTDLQEIDKWAGQGARSHFRAQELLSIPLKSCEAYRKQGTRFARWLSRRWIYNIPRTRNTEGLRPLGRLAFADHVQAIQERLHELIPQLANGDAAAATSQALGLPLDMAPRLFVLGTISGGLGSGLIADLAYLIRAVLLEHGLPDKFLTGILLHGAGRTVGEARLATANSYAFLRETSHYAKRGYPGDASLNLPAFDDEEALAFSDLYLVSCGREPFASRSVTVGDYLYLDLATGCNDFFKRCRTGRDDQGQLVLRTLGLSQLELQQENARSRLAYDLQRRLLAQWHDGCAVPDDFEALAVAQQIWQACNLTMDTVLQKGAEIARTLFGPDHGARLLKAVQEPSQADPSSANPEAVHDLLDGFYKFPGERSDDPALRLRWADLVSEVSQRIAAQIWTPVVQLLDLPEACLGGALAVYQLHQRHLHNIRAALEQEYQTTGDQWRRQHDASTDSALSDFTTAAQLRTRHAEQHCSRLLLDDLLGAGQKVQHVLDRVSELLQRTRILLDERQVEARQLPQGQTEDLYPRYQERAAQELEQLTRQLQLRMESDFFSSMGGLQQLAHAGVHQAATLADALDSEARRIVGEWLREFDFEAILQHLVATPRRGQGWLKEHLRAALPGLSNCGGTMHMVLVTPSGVRSEPWSAYIQQLTGSQPTFLPFSDGDLAVLFEGEAMPANEVAAQLIADVPSAVDYLGRVPTRLDVEWIPLTGLA